MKHYIVKYSIITEFDAESDTEANKIKEQNLNAIFKSGDFNVIKFKMQTTSYDVSCTKDGMTQYYSEDCDYLNGDNKETHYDSCCECYRYLACKECYEKEVRDKK